MPTLESKPTPVLNEVIAEDGFLSKVRPPTYAIIHAVMLSMKHLRSSTVQEELTNEGRHHLLLLHKQVYVKRGIAESLHTYIN